MPGRNPPPAYVAPPFEFAWFPITPSMVVRVAVHETAEFQDGSDPGEIVPRAKDGKAARKAVETISADSSMANVKAFVRPERARGARGTTRTFISKGVMNGSEYLFSLSTRD